MMLRTLILALVLASAIEPASAQLVMGQDAIGPIKRGWTIADILVSGMPYDRQVVPTEGDPVTIYTLEIDSQVKVEIWFHVDDTPYRLKTDSPAFKTTVGARVGDTMATLQRLYPEGRAFKTAEEAGGLSFLPFGFDANAKATLAFAFDHSTLPDDCMFYDRACPDLSAMKSESFMVTWLR